MADYQSTRPNPSGGGSAAMLPLLMQMLQQQQQSSQAPGPDPGKFLGIATGALGPLAGLAGGLVSTLGGLLAGPSQLEKAQLDSLRSSEARKKESFSAIQNRLGQSPNDPSQYLAQFQRSQAGRRNSLASGLDARLGLDSGVAAGDLARSFDQQDSGFYLDQVNQGRNERMNLLQLLSGI